MRFLHLGDLHIGKSLGDFDLYSDQEYILKEILKIADDKKVDGVIIAGDVYDKSIPTEAAVKLFDQFICSLSERKLKTFIISGNHDSDERLNFGSTLFESNSLYISAKYDGKLYKQTFTDEYGVVNVYLLPFVKASQVKRYFPEEEINTYEDAVRVLIKNANICAEERNVLVAHQYVVGGSGEVELGGSEGLSVRNVGTVEMIHSSCFEAFDYVALGHIHSAQAVEREEVRYSGSPLKYSLSEAGKDKSVPIVDILAKGSVNIELALLKPQRDLRHIKGRMETLLSRENVVNPEDFIYVTLTNEEIVNDAMAIFQQTYPNTIRINYENQHSKELEDIDISDYASDMSFTDLISDFYKQMYGRDISPEELQVMKSIAKEAGVSDEAN